MSYSETNLIRTRDCDMWGRWKPSAMMEAMQEVAISHCDTVGLGRSVTDGLGVVWVLSRCRVELKRQPLFGEKYTMKTYALPTKHLFFPRAHVIFDAAGKVIGGAHGLWLLMDMATRRIVKNDYVSERLPVEADDPGVKAPGTVRALPATPVEGCLTPQFTEFDLNGHVNNTKYMDWCWNALGFDGLKEREIAWFDVNYDREILPGEEVRTELCREEDALTFCGFAGGSRCFGISVALRRCEEADA
ncbi:MAG: hypothetical protein IJ048_03525 [Clostridia bacterium]|nr:hypothetical protein [Clostridia bacterium]